MHRHLIALILALPLVAGAFAATADAASPSLCGTRFMPGCIESKDVKRPKSSAGSSSDATKVAKSCPSGWILTGGSCRRACSIGIYYSCNDR